VDEEPIEARLGVAQPAVLALQCSDPAAREAFRQVIQRFHGEASVETVAIPGGPWWVARAANATKTRARRWIAGRVAGSVEEAIEAALSRSSLRAVELLGHQGCAWYERFDRRATPGELVRKQGEDLYLAAEELARWSRLPVAGRIVLEGTPGARVRTLFGASGPRGSAPPA
jgi:hypothetical protein